MKDQVTSIEQSKRLIELEVPADKASMVWEWVSSAVDEINYELNIWQGCKLDKILAYQEFPESFIPAFTVADLLEKVLPNVIQDAHNTYELTLKAVVGGGWRFCYTPVLTQLEADNIVDEMGDNLIELLCNRIEWIVSKGYGLNL